VKVPKLSALLVAASLATGSAASAQETLDIGVIRDSDLRVVQKMLYPKDGRLELSVAVGIMPFDAYLTTPNAQFTLASHMSESLAFGFVLGGGYGLKNGTYHELQSPTYGVAPDAYRYLTAGLVGVEWSPIYAKMNLNGARIVHFDVFGTGRAGATLEQSVIPTGGMTVAPTVSLGLGTRFFTGARGALRVEIRDDMLVEHRNLTDSTHFKQNVDVTVGYSFLSPVKQSVR
jgi:outer membrane beta-barrel protein